MILLQNQASFSCFHGCVVRAVVVLRVQSLLRMQQWNPKQFGLAPIVVAGPVFDNRHRASTLGGGRRRDVNVVVHHDMGHWLMMWLGLLRVIVVPKNLVERLVYGGG